MNPPATALAVALLLTGCGNYSNDDIAYLDALPSKEALQVNVPQSGQALGQQASLYVGTVQSSQKIDDFVLTVIGLLDAVRTIAPTQRTTDSRTWGPFKDNDPRFENEVVITRSGATFAYAFKQRQVGQGSFVDVLTGTFVGESAAQGHGTLTFDVASLVSLGHPPADPNLQSLSFVYANDSTPRSVNTTIVARSPDGGQAQLTYTFEESPAEGDLDWDFSGPSADAGQFDLRVHSRFHPQGSGRADATGTVEAYPNLEWRVTQCWDASFAERYLDSAIWAPYPDGGASRIFDYGCVEAEGQTCPVGDIAACPF